MPGRYVKIGDESVSIELSPDEWAVALDALQRVQVDRDNPYSPWNRAALSRTVRKLTDAASQLKGRMSARPTG